MTNAEARRILVDEMDADVSRYCAEGGWWIAVAGDCVLKMYSHGNGFTLDQLRAIAAYLEDPQGIAEASE